jgi:drug/metabolite transporter (DMT)-like permease
VIAILGGLGAAVMWATATLCTSRSSRMIAPATVLAWVMLVGSTVTVPFALATGVPDGLDAGTLGWLTVMGAANVVGLLMVYNALRIGKVGIVSPITSAEGAVAALIAVLAGERIGAGAATMLVLIAAGVVLASFGRDDDALIRRHNGIAVALSTGAAGLFGVGLYITGWLSDRLPVAWVLLPPRVLGVLALAVPLTIAGRMRLSRRAAPLVVAAGLCEILGLASYALGARHGIAVAAVLSSQFAVVAAVVAYFLFRERLVRVQLVGIVAVLLGVGVLTALQA